MKKSLIKKYFRNIPTLNTENLILRRLKTTDFEDMYEYAKIPSVTDFLTWHPHPDSDYTRRYLQAVQGQYSRGEFFDWAVILKSNGKMIGTCGFTSFDEQNNAGEIGYVINPNYAGKGYATEATKQVVKFGFLTLNLHRVYAKYIDGNNASRRVMEKCGMSYEGCAKSSMYIKDKYRDIHTCAIISNEFMIKYVEQ